MQVSWEYLAGFVDGEGSIGIHKSYHGRKWVCLTPCFQVSNTNREILEALKEKVGFGTITQDKRTGKNWRPTYNYCVQGFKVKLILQQLLPYLQLKKKQAELVIRFIEIREQQLKGKPFSTPYAPELFAIHEAVAKLNQKGLVSP
jgi:hypothetical protein